MNKIWRRILGIVCFVLVSVSVVVAPAVADPTNPPVWPPTANSIVVAPLDLGTTTTTTTTTQP